MSSSAAAAAAPSSAAVPTESDADGPPAAKRRPAALDLVGAVSSRGAAATVAAASSASSSSTPSLVSAATVRSLDLPDTDFLPRISELFDLVAEANDPASDDSARPLSELRDAVKEKALELRKLFNAARGYFATNQFLQLTPPELEELEQARNREKQRIENILEENFVSTWRSGSTDDTAASKEGWAGVDGTASVDEQGN